MYNKKESFSSDNIMGKVNEDKVYNIINNYWNERNITKTNDIYSNYDFYDSKYTYELKSRRCEHNKYSTTMIPEMKCHKRTYLLFFFTDGLYYIRYNKKLFDNFEKKMFVKNRYDKQDKQKYYYYIPVEYLKKIEIKNKEFDQNDFTLYFN
jgi:hypothetical protein